jgi:hypothetical protein
VNGCTCSVTSVTWGNYRPDGWPDAPWWVIHVDSDCPTHGDPPGVPWYRRLLRRNR